MAAVVLALLFTAKVAFAQTDMGADAQVEPSLEISYEQPLRCGVPTTFTLSVVGIDEYESFKSKIASIYGYDPIETRYTVVDGSRQAWMSQWSETGKTEFTFFASGRYDLKFQALIKGVDGKFSSLLKNVTIYIDDPAYPSLPDKAKKLVDQCKAEGNITDFAKALWLHDWIMDHCTYDYSLLYCNAEGALARGTGTCEAYHRAYVLLLNTAGIQTDSMAGNGHRWTAAKLDGAWYQIDVTWDDYEVKLQGTYPDVTHLYFGLSDKLMQIAHSDHRPVVNRECNALADNYFIKTREIEQWSEFALSKVQSALDSGTASFSISVQHASMINPYRDILYNLVAYDLQTRSWKAGQRDVALKVDYADGVLGIVATYGAAPKPEPDPKPQPQPPTLVEPGTSSQSAAVQDMHRLYNPNSGEHFYTADVNERDHLVSVGWEYEGHAWKAPRAGEPVYRMYNANAGDHHYTMSAGERDSLVAAGWNYEGVGWYSDPAKKTSLFRLYNPNAIAGSHHYTTSIPERESLKSIGWRDEGVAWYGCR